MKPTEPTTVVLTTAKLIEHLEVNEGSCIEASLCLNGGGLSTHFLIYKDGLLYDEGCDGEERETTLQEFAKDSFYGNFNARWVLYSYSSS